MLKGAGLDTVPDMVPARVLCTVKVRSAKLPRSTVPKSTVLVGLTVNPICATALAWVEQALSVPLAFTAVTET
jgi:hypothetical protein